MCLTMYPALYFLDTFLAGWSDLMSGLYYVTLDLPQVHRYGIGPKCNSKHVCMWLHAPSICVRLCYLMYHLTGNQIASSLFCLA